ncbi:hypothetical protein KY347_02465 [Candidatus Woesearchaeota archaeon]|nr:hypothetical protein [Candidatus Woesearchaeota archaeon]
MDINERILAIVREKGPVLPVRVSKEINESIIMASARLSELLSRKQIKISSLKVGGSPLYYSPGHEHKLQDFVDNLHEKEKKAYHLLKQSKILKDSDQDPVVRVALRGIKDFAVPLQVNYENKAEIFWKWYLTDSKEAELLIREILTAKEKITPEKLPEKPEEERKEPIELKKDTTKKFRSTIDKDTFLKEVNNFFGKNKINIIETYNTKKASEIDFVIGLHTSIGTVKYFCKSKNKKKINDSDISTAILQAQSKNLPLLLLANGELTKKANELINQEFKNITFRKI